jgi:hypothetical protein
MNTTETETKITYNAYGEGKSIKVSGLSNGDIQDAINRYVQMKKDAQSGDRLYSGMSFSVYKNTTVITRTSEEVTPTTEQLAIAEEHYNNKKKTENIHNDDDNTQFWVNFDKTFKKMDECFDYMNKTFNSFTDFLKK